MTDPLAALRERVAQTIVAAARKAFASAEVQVDPAWITTEVPEHVAGDLCLPCFALARSLRRNPKQIAEALEAALPPDDRLLETGRAVGPYLNIHLRSGPAIRFIAHGIAGLGEHYGPLPVPKPERIMVEYSSPNTNKPQHLGHVRNNTIGMALSNLLAALGHTVIRCNLINDRGIHICKSMLAYMLFGNGETPDSAGEKGDHFVGRYYVLFQQKVEQDPSLQTQAEELLRRWEAGDPHVRALWKQMNEWVYAGFEATYRDYGCRFDVTYHESDTYELGRAIAERALALGVAYRRDDGAVEVDLSPDGLDRKVLLRPDGTTVYITQDLGTAVRKFEEHHLDRSIYVTGSEQIYHFQVLFLLLHKLGYSWATGCRHYPYGMVYLPEGKMKSREGKVVDADDLLAQLESAAEALIREKHPDMDLPTLASRRRQVALAAIKYFILRVDPTKDIHFDPQQEMNFQGNTGPYLQYAHVRVAGILRKAGLSAAQVLDTQPRYESLETDEDMALALAMARYPSVVAAAAETLNPALVAGYLYDLARTFTQFYDNCPVLDAPGDVRSARLGLIALAARVLRNGLGLLGIDAPETM